MRPAVRLSSSSPIAGRSAAVAALTAGAAIAVLAGCGRADPAVPPPAARAAAAPAVAPLVDAQGRPLPSTPPDGLASPTRLGLYATPEQVVRLRRALWDDVIEIAAPAVDGDRAVAETVAAVWHLQDADDHSADAPVLVSGADARVVAAVVDRLVEHGRTRVWQVVAR